MVGLLQGGLCPGAQLSPEEGALRTGLPVRQKLGGAGLGELCACIESGVGMSLFICVWSYCACVCIRVCCLCVCVGGL